MDYFLADGTRLIITLTEEGIIADVYDKDGAKLLDTYAATADEFADTMFTVIRFGANDAAEPDLDDTHRPALQP